jgi:hypothetical protein
MEIDAPYNEIDYVVDCIITVSVKRRFSARPNLTDEEREDFAKNEIRDEFGKSLECIDLVEVYKA